MPTHTHSSTHAQTHRHAHIFFPQGETGQSYIVTECKTIIHISINDHKTKILFPQKVTKKCNNHRFKKLEY